MSDAYWGFYCRKCGLPLRLNKVEYGPDGQPIPVTGTGLISLPCEGCHSKHEYNRQDAIVIIGPEGSPSQGS